jgi:hypothetical protein
MGVALEMVAECAVVVVAREVELVFVLETSIAPPGGLGAGVLLRRGAVDRLGNVAGDGRRVYRHSSCCAGRDC